MHIYVASSWRNALQPDVVQALREGPEAHTVYDFRHPPGGDHLGFSWDEIDPDWRTWSKLEYLAAIEHPIAQAGFASDFQAMQRSHMGVLVLPSGRSAHLEAGYFVGAGKPLIILVPADDPGEAELMYLMADAIALSVGELIAGVSALEHHWRLLGQPAAGWRDVPLTPRDAAGDCPECQAGPAMLHAPDCRLREAPFVTGTMGGTR